MSKMIQLKKSVSVLAAAVFLASGAMSGHAVTAWATPVSGTANIDGVRVRDSAVDGAMVGSLTNGQEVTIEDETTGSDGMVWYQIAYELNGQEITGWVRSDLLVTSDDEDGTDADTVDETEAGFIIADSIPADVMPDGFEETTVTYSGEQVPALYSEVRNLYLLYAVSEEDETDAGLFVFDEQNDGLIPYVQFELQDGTVVLTNIPEDEQQLVADRFVLTECAFEHGSISSYQLSEPDEMVADDASIVDYYYVYGVNDVGETGWYLYNAAEGSIQKNLTNMQYSISSAGGDESAGAQEDADSAFSIDSLTKMVVAVLAVICLLLLVLAIIFSMRYRRLRNILEKETENQAEYAVEDAAPKKSRSSEKKRQDAEESLKSGKKEKKDMHKPAAKEKMLSKDDESRPDKPAAKKHTAESRDGMSNRRTEPDELHLFSDDVDVMDLDSMEDEDYEALLNKYLDENFSDEEEGEENAGSEMPELVLPEDDASPSKTDAGDFLDEDYDMPEFLKADTGTQEFEDMDLDLDISTSGQSDQSTCESSNKKDDE